MQQPVIMVFDSGLGGITVYRQLKKQLPRARYLYVADDAAFPYGAWEEADLTQRILTVVGKFVTEVSPDMVVVACNTASTIALEALRQSFDIPFVGTVPAIKVAAQRSESKVFAVLATPGTVKRDYTRVLVKNFAGDCHVVLVGADGLAAQAERKMAGQAVDLEAVKQMVAPCFVEHEGRRTDHIALACTHFPLLLEELGAFSPWSVSFIDPAPAIARQAVSIVQDEGLSLRGRLEGWMPHDILAFTGRANQVEPGLQDFLGQEGLGHYGFTYIRPQ